jgi:hypothetical protein
MPKLPSDFYDTRGNIILPLLYPPRKAALFLGVGKNKLRALLSAGHIKAKLIDGRRYYVTASLIGFRDTLADTSGEVVGISPRPAAPVKRRRAA